MKIANSSQRSAVSGWNVSSSILYSLLSILSAASAQESKTNAPTVLPTVVVTATRTEEPVDKTAASVSVITRTAIEDQMGGENKKAFTSANWRMKASQNPDERQFGGLASSFSLSEKWTRVSVP